MNRQRTLIADLCRDDAEFFRRLWRSDEPWLDGERLRLQPLFDFRTGDDRAHERYALIREVLDQRRLERESAIPVPREFERRKDEFRFFAARLGCEAAHEYLSAKLDNLPVDGLFDVESGQAPALDQPEDLRRARQSLFPGSPPDGAPLLNWDAEIGPPPLCCMPDFRCIEGYPNAPESIDDLINKMWLINPPPGYARLKSPQRVEKSRIHYEARLGVFHALERATGRCPRGGADVEREHIRKLLGEYRKDLAGLEALDVPLLMKYSLASMGAIDEKIAFARENILHHELSLKAMDKQVNIATSGKAKVWMWVFIQELFYIWRQFTGEVFFKKTGPFKAFVAAAYRSASGSGKMYSWDNALTYARSHMFERVSIGGRTGFVPKHQ
jgi:hypothetical protein